MATGSQDPQANRDVLARSRILEPITLAVEPGGPYRVPYDFDLGRDGIIHFTATLLTFDTDGETPGAIAADLYQWKTYEDEARTLEAVVFGDTAWITDEPFSGDPTELPLITHRAFGLGGRYARIVVNIIDANTFDPYAGANTPSATWRIDFQ